MTRISAVHHWITRRTTGIALGLAVVLALAAAAFWAFAELTEEVMGGKTHTFDTAILLALRAPGAPADPLGPPWFEDLARDVTGLGGFGVLGFLTLATAGVLWLSHTRRTVLYVLVAVAGGITLSSTAKAFFDRPHPDLVPHGTLVYTASFPSGHSLMAAVVYLTLAALVGRTFPQQWIQVYVVVLAVFITLAVGISRVYLGVHWPTDVLASWAAGAAWALTCAALADALSRRGAIEAANGGAPEA